MPNNLSGWADKAKNVTAILILVGIVGAWLGGLIPSYALSSELEQHISKSDERVKFDLEDKILIIEDELEIYKALKISEALPVKDAIREHQLVNRKERYLRQLKSITER